MKILFKSFLTATLLMFLTVSTAYATNYYVAKTGSNANAGTLAAPWLTIGKAASTLAPGDTVFVRSGTYNEHITPAVSGSATSKILYKEYPGDTVVIDGTGTVGWDWDGVFSLVNRNYIEISGFRIINSRGFGIFASNSHNLGIYSNSTYNTGMSGIWIGDNSYSVTVDANEIEHSNTLPNQEALSISGSHDVAVSHNIVHDGLKEGIDAKGSYNVQIFGNTVYDMTGMGIYVDSYLNTPLNIQIYNNVVRDTKVGSGYYSSRDGIMLAAESGNYIDGVNIYNNIIYNIAGTGILLSHFHSSGPLPQHKNTKIYNNTIHRSSLAGSGYGGVNIQGASNSNVLVRNNILSRAGTFNIVATSGTTISHNLFFSGSTSGTNYVIGNPLFVTEGSNFHLQSTSPAINVALTSGAPVSDFDGNARPQGMALDMGAFEYLVAGTPPTAPTLTFPTISNLPTYTWKCIPSASSYQLYVDDSSGNRIAQWYSDAEVNQGGGNCAYTSNVALNSGIGAWRVRGYNAYGYGDWSTVWNFTVQ